MPRQKRLLLDKPGGAHDGSRHSDCKLPEGRNRPPRTLKYVQHTDEQGEGRRKCFLMTLHDTDTKGWIVSTFLLGQWEKMPEARRVPKNRLSSYNMKICFNQRTFFKKNTHTQKKNHNIPQTPQGLTGSEVNN